MLPSKINRISRSFLTDPNTAQILAAIHRACFETPWSEKSFQELLLLPTTFGWLSEDGFLLCSHTFDEMEILTICTRPQKRRQGLAKELINHMLEYAKIHQVHKIFLEVSQKNEAAKALYFSVGFEINAVRKNYYKTSNGFTDALCMMKIINNKL